MDTPINSFLISILLFDLYNYPYFAESQRQGFRNSVDNFAFNGFNDSEHQIIQVESTVIKPSGALRLTNNSHDTIGRAFFANPLRLLNTSSSSSAAPAISSFSTHFVFQIVPADHQRGGYGLAFTLSPSPRFPGGEGGHYLGVLNSSNDGNSSNRVFMVEFDTVNGFLENLDSNGNHVGINVNSMNSRVSEPAAYHKNGTAAKEEFDLEKKPIQVWIDYDGGNKILNVTVSPIHVQKPSRPLITTDMDFFSGVMEDEMYAGFSASTGQKRSAHYILGWSFRLNGIADSLDISKLPVLPVVETESSSSLSRGVREALISAFSVGLFCLLVALAFVIYRKKTQFKGLEDWELDCPRRLLYRDLHSATKGFKNSELIGSGGFGEVYRGVLKDGNGAEIAVKKISNNSVQGVREFAAEIESLGRLRHKNLVNLQGWCKHKNDLLLVYDYVSNGSLDRLIYNLSTTPTPTSSDHGITWEKRFSIIKGIASGLLYLHEEWEQVVIHRDVKSSNVLIDSDMNARLGDFGLARLYNRSRVSYTTNVVGTIGYIAPELTRTGKASTSSDVFAFGVVLLEVACGKPPILYDPGVCRDHLTLVDWVVECLQSGKVLDAVVDPKLNGVYVMEEIELVLGLGLLCSHYRPEARPTMRQVMRYLNGDEDLIMPGSNINSFCGSGGSFKSGQNSKTRWSSEFLGFLSGEIQNTRESFEVVSSGAIPVSYNSSSSIGRMSISSFGSGR